MSKLMKELVILSVDRVCDRWVEHFICKRLYGILRATTHKMQAV